MFKKTLSNLNKYLLLPFLGWFSFVHFAHAETSTGGISSVFGLNLNALIAEFAASISNMILGIMSLWVTLTGALLNVSIDMTLHIKDFVDKTQGVYLVWQTIRDVSGMFIIFLLLYASIKIILGFDSMGGVGNLIKNIVIVGILINFSFFITSMLIDASNIVSLALYNGIVGNPTQLQIQAQNAANAKAAAACGQAAGTVNSCVTATAMLDPTNTENGGMSAIFMNILSPQSIYNNANKETTDATNSSYGKDQAFGILVQGIVGVVIMFTIGLSFLLASLAFIVRLIVLIFLLAFSPIWFASWVIPGLDEKAKEFTTQLKAQLIFMPVYLLLLYAALSIAAKSTVFTNLNTNSLGANSLTAYIVLAVNDLFIVFMLNLPLVVAFSMGGIATKYIKADKFGAAAIWKGFGKGTGGFAGRNIVGRGAYIANNSGVLKNISARVPFAGNAISKQLGKVENYGFGKKKGGFKDVTEARQKDYEKQYEAVGKASAAEKALYNDPTKRNEKGEVDEVNGKTELERFLAKRQDQHFANISKPTIMSNLVNKAVKVSNAIAPGSISAATQANVASSFSVGESAAMQTLKKKRDADEKKAEAKKAKESLDKLTEANNKRNREADDLMETLKLNEKDLDKATNAEEKDYSEFEKTKKQEMTEYEKNKGQEAERLRSEIKTIEQRNSEVMPVNRTSSATQTASLSRIESELAAKKAQITAEIATRKVTAETKIASLKDKKVRAENSRLEEKETINSINEEFEKAKRDFQKAIDAGKDVTEAERFANLDKKIEESGKKSGGESKGGGGGEKKEEKK